MSECGQDRFRPLRRHGATPLHIAAIADAWKTVAELLEGGADPDDADATSATPLHYAAAGDSGVVSAGGAAAGAATTKGVTPPVRIGAAGRGLGGQGVAGTTGGVGTQPPSASAASSQPEAGAGAVSRGLGRAPHLAQEEPSLIRKADSGVRVRDLSGRTTGAKASGWIAPSTPARTRSARRVRTRLGGQFKTGQFTRVETMQLVGADWAVPSCMGLSRGALGAVGWSVGSVERRRVEVMALDVVRGWSARRADRDQRLDGSSRLHVPSARAHTRNPRRAPKRRLRVAADAGHHRFPSASSSSS